MVFLSGKVTRYYRQKSQYLQSGLAYDSALFGQRVAAGGLLTSMKRRLPPGRLAAISTGPFFDLYLAVRLGKLARPEAAAKDDDLLSLRADKRWPDVLDRMKVNQMEQEGKFDRALEDTLNLIYTKDQAGRLADRRVSRSDTGRAPNRWILLWESISHDDSADLERIPLRSSVAAAGHPPDVEVGERASMAVSFWYFSTRIRGYTPPMSHLCRAAVRRGTARPEDLALMEDRLLTEQGETTALYGSQVRMDSTGKASFFPPIADEAEVNKRRASVGLEPLESYARYFGIDYRLPSR